MRIYNRDPDQGKHQAGVGGRGGRVSVCIVGHMLRYAGLNANDIRS